MESVWASAARWGARSMQAPVTTSTLIREVRYALRGWRSMVASKERGNGGRQGGGATVAGCRLLPDTPLSPTNRLTAPRTATQGLETAPISAPSTTTLDTDRRDEAAAARPQA